MGERAYISDVDIRLIQEGFQGMGEGVVPDSLPVVPVPEPSSIINLATGLVFLLILKGVAKWAERKRD